MMVAPRILMGLSQHGGDPGQHLIIQLDRPSCCYPPLNTAASHCLGPRRLENIFGNSSRTLFFRGAFGTGCTP
jgi:hypothetical protein